LFSLNEVLLKIGFFIIQGVIYFICFRKTAIERLLQENIYEITLITNLYDGFKTS
jgi:hypothetical protein